MMSRRINLHIFMENFCEIWERGSFCGSLDTYVAGELGMFLNMVWFGLVWSQLPSWQENVEPTYEHMLAQRC